MISLLQSIVDTIKSVLLFVGHSLTSMLNLLNHIPSYVSFLSTSISYLPSVVMPFCIASISIYIVYVILGRNS